MKLAAVLPHFEVFGGVRRYIEIGNELSKRGHDFVIFTPDGLPPRWLDFKGKTSPFSHLEEEIFDACFCSEYSVLDQFERLKAKQKFFYFLLEGHKKEREVMRKDFVFLGNSEGICRRIEKRYGVRCLKLAGGVNLLTFYPSQREGSKDEFRILCYGRLSRKRKGISHVIRAAESLYKKHPNLKLILFDSLVGRGRIDSPPVLPIKIPYEFHLNLPQEKMAWLYSQADVFVSAERRAGWSNTTAEAMACKIPVICTKSGTQDFAFHQKTALVVRFPYSFFLKRAIKKLLYNENLRHRLACAGYERIKSFTWSSLVDRLEEILGLR